MNTFQKYMSDPENLKTVIAAVAVIVSFLSTLLALWSVYLQRKHNQISVKPLPDMIFGDYTNEIKVALHNHGLGPMILTKVEILKDEILLDDDLISLMPEPPKGIDWDDFVELLKDRILAPGEEKMLVKLSGNPTNKTFVNFRNKVREELAPLKVKVYYKGIYDKEETVFEKSLDWFRRPI